MPTFENIEVEIETNDGKTTETTSVDFEVFCEKCGAGICNHASTRHSRRRNYLQVTITPCETCMAAALDEGKELGRTETEDELNATISELEAQIKGLEAQIKELEQIRELEARIKEGASGS